MQFFNCSLKSPTTPAHSFMKKKKNVKTKLKINQFLKILGRKLQINNIIA